MASDQPHLHVDWRSSQAIAEKTAASIITGLGFVCNAALIGVLLLQRHTRKLESAFLLHESALNLLLCAMGGAFGGVPAFTGAVSCNSLGVGFIVTTTTSAYNLAAAGCCEVFVLGSDKAKRRRRSPATLGCVLFGLIMLHICSIILHLGPTIVGATFLPARDKRCHMVYGQSKNYVVFATWILMVSIGLASACLFLAQLGSSVDLVVAARRRELTGAALARLDALLAVKRRRQRSLWAACGVTIACWYPLFFLLLIDTAEATGIGVYKFFTLLSIARVTLEPLVLLVLDGGVVRLSLSLMGRRTDDAVTEEELDEAADANAKGSIGLGRIGSTIGSRLSSYSGSTQKYARLTHSQEQQAFQFSHHPQQRQQRQHQRQHTQQRRDWLLAGEADSRQRRFQMMSAA